MSKAQGTFKRFFSSLLKIYRVFRSIILNFFFLLFVILILGSMVSAPTIVVPDGAALVFAPQGNIVEERSYVDPLDSILSGSLTAGSTEVLLQDVLNAINIAAEDEDISSLVLELSSLQGAGFTKLQDIGAAITEFKTSGKKVYALADTYSQAQYYLASYADEIMIHPLGGVDLEGFGSYQMYYGSALEKLGINMHVFRVGEFKSAVEPYERDDMSAEAKLANSAWLGDLWEFFLEDISRERDISTEAIQESIERIDVQLASYAGNTSELALQTGFVDSVMSRTERHNHMINEIGSTLFGNTFKQIDSNDYLLTKQDILTSTISDGQGNVGLIIASGTIYDGSQRPGSIGGDSLAQLVRQAREDDNIKALVLRIDSGGGSAFASEVIRNEILEFKKTGKPFIASMGSVAASGGYWIAAPADQIWASATTITGSIGIFAIYPTFEKTFETLGINTDGVGTTALSGAFAVGRNLPDVASNAIQSTLQNGYDRFLAVVAEGRDMSTEEVDAIAQGRVWSGATALEIGLVDELGDLQQAITAAAQLASLGNYETQLIGTPLTPGEQFLQDLTENISLESFNIRASNKISPSNTLMKFYQQVNNDIEKVLQFNDPRGMYAHCFECGTN